MDINEVNKVIEAWGLEPLPSDSNPEDVIKIPIDSDLGKRIMEAHENYVNREGKPIVDDNTERKSSDTQTTPGDIVKYIAIGVGVAAAILGISHWGNKVNPNPTVGDSVYSKVERELLEGMIVKIKNDTLIIE